MTEEIIINDIIINIGKNDMETCLARLLGEAAAGIFWRYAWARDAYDARLYARIKDLKSQLANATKPVEAPTAPATPTATECPFQVGDWVRWSASCDTGASALVLDVNKEAFWRSFCEPTLKSFRASQLRTRVQQSEWSDYTKVDAPAWADEAIAYAREKGLIDSKIAELLGNAAPVEELPE